MGIDINGLSQFLQGFLSEQERAEKEKKINKLMQDNKYDVEQTFNPMTGESMLRLKPKQSMTPYQQQRLQQIQRQHQDRMDMQRRALENRERPQPIVDRAGNVVGTRPQGAVFQPQQGFGLTLDSIIANEMGLKPLPQQGKTVGEPDAGGRIRVKRKSDGAIGTIEPQEFDDSIYERL